MTQPTSQKDAAEQARWYEAVRVAEHLCPTELPHLDKQRWKAEYIRAALASKAEPPYMPYLSDGDRKITDAGKEFVQMSFEFYLDAYWYATKNHIPLNPQKCGLRCWKI